MQQILLVDFENVPKVDLAAVPAGVVVPFFFGAAQKSVPTEFLRAALKLGERFVPIDIAGAGRNALDFHIAFYLGEYLTRNPAAHCVILSRDKGFDPLVKHLKGKGVFAQRAVSISSIPFFKPELPSTSDAQIDVVVAHLTKMKAAKPRAEKTLLSTLHALFKKELSDDQLSALFTSLCKRGIVKLDGTKVTYELPPKP